jgi:putative phosphoribosyl transferase
VRKLGAPGQPELAIGAIAEDGVTLINQDVLQSLFGLDVVTRSPWSNPSSSAASPPTAADGRRSRSPAAPHRRRRRPRHGRHDGSRGPRPRGAGRIAVAVPVASIEAVERLRTVAHEVVRLLAAARAC